MRGRSISSNEFNCLYKMGIRWIDLTKSNTVSDSINLMVDYDYTVAGNIVCL